MEGGLTIGMGAGMAIGIGIGISSGTKTAKKRIKQQVAKALLDEKIAIQNKKGEPVSAEEFMTLLEKF